MDEEKYGKMMNVIGDFVISELKSDKEKSPEMVTAMAELISVSKMNHIPRNIK